MVQYLREMSLAIEDEARGLRIAALREARNLTQVQLSRKLGVNSQTVSRWEGGSKMSAKNLDKLIKYFGVSAEFILEGTAGAAVVTYAAFDEYKAWLDQHPDELAALPPGALENIRTFRLSISNEYEPTLQSYMVLHSFMVGLKKRKRGRA
jgi:transcriptional regulator with XRE-family HTH domain